MPHPKQDVAWKHCDMIRDGKRVHVKCKFCGKMFKGGGIFRFKEHLAGRKGGGPMCQRVPSDVRLVIEQILDGVVEKSSIQGKVDGRVNYAGFFSDTAAYPNHFMGNEDSAPGKRRKKDSAWEHCQALANGGRVQIKCNYCGKMFKGGGIFRFKEHLAGRKGSAPICNEVPLEVRELMLQNLNEISGDPRKKMKAIDNDGNPEDVPHDDSNAFPSQYNGALVVVKAGQTYNAGNLKTMEDLEGASIGDLQTCEEERVSPDVGDNIVPVKQLIYNADNAVHMAIGRFLYDIGADANALDSYNLQSLIDLLAFGGPKDLVPASHELHGWILKKLVEEVNKDIADLQVVWKKNGCSILVEELNIENGRTILNFLISCSHGTVFLKSIDASSIIHSEDDLHALLKQELEEIGVGNVLQVITHCEERYANVGRRLMESFPSVYWAPCAAQCIDLILEDLCKLEWINTVIEQARSITRFIYNHSAVLNLMRRFTFGNDIVQQGLTRSATNFATLKQMADLKLNLQTMVTSQEWVDSPYSEQLGGLALLDIVTNRSFWSSCMLIIRLTSPLMRLFEIVTSSNRSSMGYIFAGLYRAKEAIKRELMKSEDYMMYWNIIDLRWEHLWRCPLHPAGFYLNSKYFYALEGEMQNEVLSRVFDCIERLVPDTEIQDKIVKELNMYKSAAGDLGRKMAIRARESLLPAEWWSTYGGGCSNLMRMAIRILTQPCSLYQGKQTHIAFNKVYDARNRLERQRLSELVFVQYNLRLKQLKQSPLYPLSFENTDTAEDWIVQNDLCLDDDGNLDWMSLIPSSSIQVAPLLSSNYEAEESGFGDCEVLYKMNDAKSESKAGWHCGEAL